MISYINSQPQLLTAFLDVCGLASDAGPCDNYVLRHYYDQSTGRCEYFYYGGCEGNENNFASSEECEKRCSRPDPASAVRSG